MCVTRGIRLDSAHRLPQMEYLYGLILARNQKYESAADHLSAYLKLSPQAADAQKFSARTERQIISESQREYLRHVVHGQRLVPLALKG